MGMDRERAKNVVMDLELLIGEARELGRREEALKREIQEHRLKCVRLLDEILYSAGGEAG